MDRRFLSLVVLAAVLLTGCAAARPSQYYQLTIPGNSKPVADRNPYPVTLLLGPLRSSELYREYRIVYSSKGESMGTYEYQRWAVPPDQMLVNDLLRELQASGKFRDVDILRSNSRGNYILYGRLYDFKEISGPPLVARLTMDLELHDVKTDETVWTLFYTHDEPVSEKKISAVVAALDRNAQSAISQVESGLDQYFSSHPLN